MQVKSIHLSKGGSIGKAAVFRAAHPLSCKEANFNKAVTLEIIGQSIFEFLNFGAEFCCTESCSRAAKIMPLEQLWRSIWQNLLFKMPPIWSLVHNENDIWTKLHDLMHFKLFRNKTLNLQTKLSFGIMLSCKIRNTLFLTFWMA